MSFGSRSLPPPTAWEQERVRVCKANGCLACRYMGEWAVTEPIEYHHLLSGGLRLGHRYGIALCAYHHRGRRQFALTAQETREHYGPNLHDEKRAFHLRHGANQEILNKQDDLIGYLRTTIPAKRDRRKPSNTARPSKSFRPATEAKTLSEGASVYCPPTMHKKKRKPSRCTTELALPRRY